MLASHRAYGETAKDLGFRLTICGSPSEFFSFPRFTVIVVIAATDVAFRQLPAFGHRDQKLLFLLLGSLSTVRAQGYINRPGASHLWSRFCQCSTGGPCSSLSCIAQPGVDRLDVCWGFVMGSGLFSAIPISWRWLSLTQSQLFCFIFQCRLVLNGLRVGFKYFG